MSCRGKQMQHVLLYVSHTLKLSLDTYCLCSFLLRRDSAERHLSNQVHQNNKTKVLAQPHFDPGLEPRQRQILAKPVQGVGAHLHSSCSGRATRQTETESHLQTLNDPRFPQTERCVAPPAFAAPKSQSGSSRVDNYSAFPSQNAHGLNNGIDSPCRGGIDQDSGCGHYRGQLRVTKQTEVF